jgi:hypothetical protein
MKASKIVDRLINGIEIDKIILFGSALYNEKNSKDFDLIIVSNYFLDVSRLKRSEIVKSICYPIKIDAVCFTYEEFLNYSLKSSFLLKTSKQSKCLYARSS